MRNISKYTKFTCLFCSYNSRAMSAVFATIVASGCSSDVTRFNSSSFSLTDNSLSNSSNSYVPVKGPYSLGHSLIGQEAYPVSEVTEHPIRRSDLSPPETVVSSASPPLIPDDSYRAQSVTADKTSEFEVQQGDTLYRLSQRTGISQDELIRLNALKGASLRAGQKIKVPSEKLANLSVDVSPKNETIPAEKTIGTRSQKDLRDDVTVRGESLQNDASDYASGSFKNTPKTESYTRGPLPLTPSESPSQGISNQAEKPSVRMAMLKEEELSVSTDQSSASVNSLKLLNVPKTDGQAPNILVTSRNSETVSSPSEPTSDVGRFRWPAKGRIISAFGPRNNGTVNDGIDISVPLGTDIHAAEDGVVAYAGSQLKAYGNLILIRHAKGMVTAYAHADEVKVKRGDRISRGQVIATAGKTGDVDQPKLHFEVREGPKAVDPLLHLEKL